MKNLCLFLILLTNFSCFSQDFSDYQYINIKTKEDCKNVEPKVIECANYLLSTPSTENANSLSAVQFIMRWMEATPEHTFELGGELFLSLSSDTYLVSRYLAAQAASAIKFGSTDKQNFKIKHTIAFLDYCEKPENKAKLNSKLKKYIKAKNENTLEALLAKE
nr:hypothetical protein [uncultured Flavobacterium sp.]